MQLTFLLVVLALVDYRICRLVIEDSIIGAQRLWLLKRLVGLDDAAYDLLANHGVAPTYAKKWRVKLHYLFQCPYCLGFWVAALVVWIADIYGSVPVPGLMTIAVSGAMMVPWRYIET